MTAARPAGDISRSAVDVDSAGLTLVGDRWLPPGPSRGAVLLLHGGGQTRHSWRRTGERLARAGWTAYAFDARGHGDSSWAPDGDYSASALVADARRLVAHIGARPVIVGASMGGMTALVGEGEHGDLATGLVLVDIVADPEPAGVARIQRFMGSAPDGFATLEEAADAIAAYNPNRPRPPSTEGLRKNLRQGPDGRWRWHWDPRFLHEGSEPARELRTRRLASAAEKVRVPTLIIRGANSDIVSAQGVEDMLRLIPHAEVVEVGAAGHMIAGDDNDVFTVRLTDFLEQLP